MILKLIEVYLDGRIKLNFQDTNNTLLIEVSTEVKHIKAKVLACLILEFKEILDTFNDITKITVDLEKHEFKFNDDCVEITNGLRISMAKLAESNFIIREFLGNKIIEYFGKIV